MYDTKTISELEQLAANLRLQVALHPDDELERVQLNECERWLELRKREIESGFQQDLLAS